MHKLPSKYRLRRIFRPLIIILAKLLSKCGITPNVATFIMFGMSVISFVSITVFSNLFLFSIFVFLTGIFDGIDGAIARLTGKSSSRGGFLDSFMDRCSEFLILLGVLIRVWGDILWIFFDMRLIVFVSLLASLMISYLRARAVVLHQGDYDVGLMARSERLFYLFVASLISFFIDIFNVLIFIFMILVVLTVFYRYFRIKQELLRNEVQQNKEE